MMVETLIFFYLWGLLSTGLAVAVLLEEDFTREPTYAAIVILLWFVAVPAFGIYKLLKD